MEPLARAMGMDRREVKVGVSGEMMGPDSIQRLKRLLLGDPQELQTEDSDRPAKLPPLESKQFLRD